MKSNPLPHLQRSAGPVAALTALLFLALASHSRSQTVGESKPAADGAVQNLPEITITAEAEEPAIKVPYLPPVEGTKVYAGKRASIIELKALPEVVSNNYRQAFALTPGLLVAEETTPLVSLGYRGIGSPDRAQFMQILQDGIPISADPIGYPEAYWTPPLETVQRIDFLRGGASLVYGPQPAGALNYVTLMPRTDRALGARQQFIMGTDDLISSYTAVDGTIGKLGYHGYFAHRSADGFRQANSDYETNGGRVKLVYQQDEDTRWIVGVDAFEQENGEPGGLSEAGYAADRHQTVRFNDRFKLSRYALSLELQHRMSADTELSIKTWAAYYDRWSRRQNGGGFGTVPTGATTSIDRQEFYNWGFEPRIRHDYEALGGQHTLSAGLHFYLSHSPNTTKTGPTVTSNDGPILRDSQRDILYGSVFVENKFTFGRLTITPGFRMELVNQDMTLQNFAGAAMAETNNSKFDQQPLFGLGLAYDLGSETAVYANVSQSYRATTFGQSLIPVAGGTANDAAPSVGWHYELGMRGTPRPWITWDSALFLVDLDNKFGTAGTALTSVGRSINYGWDGALQFDVIGALDAANGTHRGDHLGALNLYANASIMEARLSGGANNGGTPQFAPPYMVRTGVIYSRKSKFKIAFLGTLMARHSASDTAVASFDIPAYTTWDLTAEIPVTKNLTLIGGLNNVFDKQYYARVNAGGIDPAYGRNFYIGGSVTF